MTFKPLSDNVTRCAGKGAGPAWNRPAQPAPGECQTCRRFIAGLDVRQISQPGDVIVPWAPPPKESPCPRWLPE